MMVLATYGLFLSTTAQRIAMRSLGRIPPSAIQSQSHGALSFHFSAAVKSDRPSGVRLQRRRRGGSLSPPVQSSPSTEENQDNKRAKIGRSSLVKETDSMIFSEAARKLLSKVKEGLVPMERANDVFVVTSTPNSLKIELRPGDGIYTMEVDDDAKCLYLQSFSGRFTYVFNSRTSEWVSADDGHIFEGMLVRDLISQCKGVPDL